MTDAIKILRGLEEMYPETKFINRLLHCVEKYPELNWGDAMSRGQITSKLWLIRHLQYENRVNLGTMMICGGWVGMLSRLILDHDVIKTKLIWSVDSDADATLAARELNYDYFEKDEFASIFADCHDLTYTGFDTIINTSCEHFADIDGWLNLIPSGKMVILQSNDFVAIEDHVDCVFSVNELVNKAGLRTVIWSGELPCHGYTRYMVIGVK